MSTVKKVILAMAVVVIFFCVSYMATLKLVVEPRYQYLTEEGVVEEIAELKSEIARLNQQIQELEAMQGGEENTAAEE